MNIDIKYHYIARESGSTDELINGMKLFEAGSLTNLVYYSYKSLFQGTVNDKGTYCSVSLKFNSSGDLRLYRCTCGYYLRKSRACAHITAAMIFIMKNLDAVNRLTDSVHPEIQICDNGILAQKQNSQDNGGNKTLYLKDYLQGVLPGIDSLKNEKPEKPKKSKPIKKPAAENKPLVLHYKAAELFSDFTRINSCTDGDEAKDKQIITLVPTYSLYKSYSGIIHRLEFHTGGSRLYVVKNIFDYVNAIHFGRKFEFGKNFIYDPENMEFDSASQKLIDILVSICSDRKYLNPERNYYYGSSTENRLIELPNSKLVEYFELCEEIGQPVRMDIGRGTEKNVDIINSNPPFKMKLQKIQGGLKLVFGFNSTAVTRLDYESRYIMSDSTIYKVCSGEHSKILCAFCRYLEAAKGNEIIIPDSEVYKFYNSALPLFEKIAEVDADPQLNELYVKEELQARIYFDRASKRSNDGIAARVEFTYGDKAFNPLLKQSNVRSDGKIIIRDERLENRILKVFEKTGFISAHDTFELFEEDRIFEFLYEELETLGELAEVFYSEDFKALRLQNNCRISAGVRLSMDGELLEFSISCEGMDEKELSRLLSAYRLKKKYYKLKNGSFLPLENSQTASLARIADVLGLSDGDLEKKLIQLPKYRAMVLDSLSREDAGLKLDRSTNFKTLVQNITEPQDMEYEVPDKLKTTLRDYQKTGFKWLNVLADYGFGGILADDMGLGKTLQVLAFLQYRKERGLKKGPAIVVAPTSLVYNWLEEVAKFPTTITAKAVSGAAAERRAQLEELDGVDLIITSYGMLKRDIDLYNGIKFRYCFLDEAQHIKNPGTLNAQTVKQLNADNYFALTGTPIENSLTELWSVFDYMMPGYLFTHNRFTAKFETPIVKQQDSDALKELGRHIRPFILRRMKRDVLLELPEKSEIRMTCTLEEEQKKVYVAYMMKAKKVFEDEVGANGFDKSRIKILALLTRLRQICCHPSTFIENYEGGSGKTELFFELMEDAIGGGHRVLAFSQFTGMLDILKKELDGRKISYFYLDGSTLPKDRMEMVNSFNKGKNKLFLISLKAGGTGLNLTGADTVIHLDPWWNPAVEDQATDRAYRIGQKNPVTVYKLVTNGTIEEKIFALQARKKELVDSVIKPGENFLTRMTADEVRSLFELE